MDILQDKQFVSIPRKQYEEMEQIVKEKKDIRVDFKLTIIDRNYFPLIKDIRVSKYIYELNDKIEIEKLEEVSLMIEAACNEISEIKNEEIDSLSKKLISIKSKWWYKLFGGSI
jgi:MoaA/NifB/PqqE/SkfB family radical SAM enzyme